MLQIISPKFELNLVEQNKSTRRSSAESQNFYLIIFSSHNFMPSSWAISTVLLSIWSPNDCLV